EVLAAEFPIGDAVQAEGFLELHDVANRLVLDLAKLRPGDLALPELFACVDHRLRAQEAAAVVGAERRLVARGHQPGYFTFSILSNSTFQSFPSFISQRRM